MLRDFKDTFGKEDSTIEILHGKTSIWFAFVVMKIKMFKEL